MDFKYLYNPDNGICHPYSEFMASNRHDLIPLCGDELPMLRTVSVADILARRAAQAAPTASVTVEMENEPPKEEAAPTPAVAAPVASVAKGVSVVGKVEKQEKVDEFDFVDKRNYRKYYIHGGEAFPIDEVANVPNEDLVRFAKEVLGRNYDDAPELGTNEERDAHYAMLREKLVKALTRIYRKRAIREAEEAKKNGGND